MSEADDHIPKHCVNSGWCCIKGPCPSGLAKGYAARQPCPELRTVEGRHLCGLVLDAERPELMLKKLRVGRGCSTPLSPHRIARIPKA